MWISSLELFLQKRGVNSGAAGRQGGGMLYKLAWTNI